MGFSPLLLLERLEQLPNTRSFRLAYSGGMDSHVLLHAAAAVRGSLSAPVAAVHIDHGLQPGSGQWSAHCTRVCRELGVPLEVRRLRLTRVAGESPEATARSARYEAIAALMEPGEVLLTAHHRDDQAETVLLQLLRGSGPRGLAGMPMVTAFPPGRLARPLLGFDRAELAEYARSEGLDWVEDGSNTELKFDRNFLRHEILPRLGQRWPGLGKTLSRSARHCAEAAALSDDLARADLASAHGRRGALSVSALTRLSPARCRAALRLWVRYQGLAAPSTACLERVLHDVLRAAPQRSPVVSWAGAEVRRYRDNLFLLAPTPTLPGGAGIPWRPDREELFLPSGLGRLLARGGCEGGIDATLWSELPVEIRFRRGGERCRIGTAGPTRSLKALTQELGVPPWLRGRLPLVYLGDRLAAVADLWVCADLQAPAGQGSGIGIRWLDRPGELPRQPGSAAECGREA